MNILNRQMLFQQIKSYRYTNRLFGVTICFYISVETLSLSLSLKRRSLWFQVETERDMGVAGTIIYGGQGCQKEAPALVPHARKARECKVGQQYETKGHFPM